MRFRVRDLLLIMVIAAIAAAIASPLIWPARYAWSAHLRISITVNVPASEIAKVTFASDFYAAPGADVYEKNVDAQLYFREAKWDGGQWNGMISYGGSSENPRPPERRCPRFVIVTIIDREENVFRSVQQLPQVMPPAGAAVPLTISLPEDSEEGEH